MRDIIFLTDPSELGGVWQELETLKQQTMDAFDQMKVNCKTLYGLE